MRFLVPFVLTLICACSSDVTPENWSSDYVSSYGGTYGEEEQILRG